MNRVILPAPNHQPFAQPMRRSQRSQRHPDTLVIIDAAVDDAVLLALGVHRTIDVIIPAVNQDAIQQITAYLQANETITHLVIMAHGESGRLWLGDRHLDVHAVQQNETVFAGWGQQLKQISLYSCQVASGPIGTAFLDALHQTTGTAIAASTRPIGSTHRGSTWTLDTHIENGVFVRTPSSSTDKIDSILRPEIRACYSGRLGTLTVNSLDDNTNSGDGFVTLREAIAAANTDTTTDLGDQASGFDTIIFDASLSDGRINLNLGELLINSDVSIDGSTAPGLVISGNSLSRVFNIVDGDTTLDSLTISDGLDTNGAGIRVNNARLTIQNSLLTNHTDSGSGGAIYASGSTLSITNTTLTNNTSATFGAGMTLVDGTDATVLFSTIVNNQGSGIDRVGDATLSIGHTLLADNTRGNIPLSTSNTTSLDFNLADDITVGFNQSNDRINQADAAINLGSLSDNGGATQTIPLLPGSVAIDTGAAAIAVVGDQRGVTRPTAARADIGAFEAALPVVTITAITTNDTTPELTGTVTLAGGVVDETLVVTVTIDAVDYLATTNSDGSWTLPNDTTMPLADGTYDVQVSATNISGTGTDTTLNELVIDTVSPVVTVNALSTSDTSPALTGTVTSTNAAIAVTINGIAYTAQNNGDGTWILADDTVASLEEATYDVEVTATDELGNIGVDTTVDELVIDSSPPVVSLQSQVTNDATPSLSGTINDSTATIDVTVNGTTYSAQNNGDGTWALADDRINPPLTDGTYDVVVTATDPAGNVGMDATADELVIDTTGPVITVDALSTADETPTLTGTISDPTAIIRVTVDGTVYEATNNGTTWSLNGDLIFPTLSNQTFDIIAQAIDAAGNSGFDNTVDELTVDTVAPAITITSLITNDPTPALTGSVNDPTATISITVNDEVYAAVNNGDGTWTLADNAIALPLADGTFDVIATATDAVGNRGTDSTTNELVIDTTSPVVTVSSLITNDATPALAGTIDDPDATLTVTLDSVTYAAVNNGDGTWIVADDRVNPALNDGTFDVMVSAIDAVGNVGVDGTSDELSVDTVAPVVTVDGRITNDTTPQLTGTVNELTTAIDVTINGVTYSAINNGNGSWTLPDNVSAPLDNRTFDVEVVATDLAGNVGTDASRDELIVDAIAPVVTVDDLGTNDPSPTLTGTIDDPTATIQVTVNRVNYTAVNNGDGTWTLADNTITPELADGTYEVSVSAVDAATNTSSDTASLTIDTVIPVVTLTPLSTNDSSPALTGTISELDATIDVTVDGTVYSAQNNGDGTWTLADNTITPLADGTFDVNVIATDAGGNVGNDASTDELLIDTQLPVITVDSLRTIDRTPSLTGTIDDPTAVIQLTINRNAYDATNIGDGTWFLDDDVITPPLTDGTFDVEAVASDSVGNLGTDATLDEVFVDATPPTVTVNPLFTADNTPEITGTVDDLTATLEITVAGTAYPATVDGDGTWTLTDDAIAPALPDGTYDVAVTATDELGNVGTDDTTDELSVDTTAPVVTVDPLSTNDNTPTLTGTLDDATALLEVTVNGTTVTVPLLRETMWELPLGDPLADGTYDVVAIATDAVGNIGTDSTTDDLLIDTVAPVVTVNRVATNDTTPPLSGTIDDPTAIVQIGLGLQIATATNNGDGTWNLEDNVITPALPDGAFNLKLVATDDVGNVGQDSTSNELVIDTTAPTVDIVDVAPDPRGPVGAIALVFSEAVSGFDLSDLTLTRDGVAIALSDATLTSTDGITWTLGNLSALTTLTGTYSLSLPGSGTSIIDEVGNLLQTGTTDTWRIENVTLNGLPAPTSINGQTGTTPAPIPFSGGRSGINESGTGGNDRLSGTGNRDRLAGKGGNDRLFGRGGADRLFGDNGSDRLFGENGNDRLEGGGGSDRLEGGSGRDRLRGNSGSDRILGGGGADLLVGGKGADTLTGNAGRDQFVIESLSDGVDTITDFNTADDFIDLTGILSSSQFAASSGFEKIRQFVRLNQVGGNTEVSIDADGNGSGTTLQRLVILQGINSDAVVSTNFLA